MLIPIAIASYLPITASVSPCHQPPPPTNDFRLLCSIRRQVISIFVSAVVFGHVFAAQVCCVDVPRTWSERAGVGWYLFSLNARGMSIDQRYMETLFLRVVLVGVVLTSSNSGNTFLSPPRPFSFSSFSFTALLLFLSFRLWSTGMGWHRHCVCGAVLAHLPAHLQPWQEVIRSTVVRPTAAAASASR